MAEHSEMSTSEAVPPPSTGRSIWQNLRDVVLFALSATFEDVRERPRWLVPLLVIAGLTLILSYFMLPAVLRDAAGRDDGPRHDGGAEG